MQYTYHWCRRLSIFVVGCVVPGPLWPHCSIPQSVPHLACLLRPFLHPHPRVILLHCRVDLVRQEGVTYLKHMIPAGAEACTDRVFKYVRSSTIQRTIMRYLRTPESSHPIRTYVCTYMLACVVMAEECVMHTLTTWARATCRWPGCTCAHGSATPGSPHHDGTSTFETASRLHQPHSSIPVWVQATASHIAVWHCVHTMTTLTSHTGLGSNTGRVVRATS